MSRPLVLIVSPVPTHPTNEGNRERVLQMAEGLREIGCDVEACFVGIPPFGEWTLENEAMEYWKDKATFHHVQWRRRPGCWTLPLASLLTVKLQALLKGVFNWFPSGGWCPVELGPWLQSYCDSRQPQCVLFEYAFLAPAADPIKDKTKVVIDTHDVFTERNQRLTALGLRTAWLNLSGGQEKKLLERAQMVVAIQEEEEAVFRAMLNPRVQVRTMDILAPAQPLPPPSECGPTVGFLGSSNPLNILGLQWFGDHAWPLIKAKVPGARLQVGGKVSAHVNAKLGADTVGHVADRSEFYGQCRLVINPCPGGTGLKIKSIEALQHRRPLVTTTEGASGLPLGTGAGMFITDDPGDFADRCVRLLLDPALADSMAAEAGQFYAGRRACSLGVMREAVTGRSSSSPQPSPAGLGSLVGSQITVS